MSRVPDPRRNDPSGQEQMVQLRTILDRNDRRDVSPGEFEIAHLYIL